MSKRKCVNELSIMKKDMQKHLKKDMKDEMTRYKDDKDEIRRMVREGTLKGKGLDDQMVNYISDTNFSPRDINVIKNNGKMYRALYDNPLNPLDLNTLIQIGIDNPELEKKPSANKKQKEQSIQIYKQGLIEQSTAVKNKSKKTTRPYDISTDERFDNAYHLITGKYRILEDCFKFEYYVLIPEVRQSLGFTDKFEQFLNHKRTIDNDTVTVGDIMDNYKIQKSMASFDFYQKGTNGGKTYFIDTKFYNNDNRGKYKMNNNIGVRDLIKAYDKTYKEEKDLFEQEMKDYEDQPENRKEILDVQKKGFDKWFHNSESKFDHYIPLTVAKIKGSSDGATLVKWKGDKITVQTKKYSVDLFDEEDYADDIKFIFSYSDGVYEVNIKDLPFFNKTTHSLDLGLSKGGKDYKLPPKYLKFIKKFI